MKDVLLVLAGALSSIAGGFLATWYRARIAGEVKLKETIAERKVAAYGKGLELIGRVQSVLVQETKEGALAFLYKHGSWFADNLILLPHTFVVNWRSIRQNLKIAITLADAQQKKTDEDEREGIIGQCVERVSFCEKLAKEAEASIRDELDLPEFAIKHPPDTPSEH